MSNIRDLLNDELVDPGSYFPSSPGSSAVSSGATLPPLAAIIIPPVMPAQASPPYIVDDDSTPPSSPASCGEELLLLQQQQLHHHLQPAPSGYSLGRPQNTARGPEAGSCSDPDDDDSPARAPAHPARGRCHRLCSGLASNPENNHCNRPCDTRDHYLVPAHHHHHNQQPQRDGHPDNSGNSPSHSPTTTVYGSLYRPASPNAESDSCGEADLPYGVGGGYASRRRANGCFGTAAATTAAAAAATADAEAAASRQLELERNRATSSRFRQNARDEACRVTAEITLLRAERAALRRRGAELVAQGKLRADTFDGTVAPNYDAVNDYDIFLPQSQATSAILGVDRVSEPVARVMIEIIAARRCMLEKPRRNLTVEEVYRMTSNDYDKCIETLKFYANGAAVPRELFDARFAELYRVYRNWDAWETAGGPRSLWGWNPADDYQPPRPTRDSRSLSVKKCRRCHIMKTAGSGHRRSHCADGVLVSSDTPFRGMASAG